MASIQVSFGGVEIENVTSVTPADSFSVDAIIDASSLVGGRTSTVTVSGYVRKPGLDKDLLLEAQKTFTEQFAGMGPDTIEYPGITPYTARLKSIEWNDWTGGPIARYTLTFEGETENPFSSVVKIAPSAVLVPPEKTFDPVPSVSDSFRSPDVLDERTDAVRDKTITLSGILRGTLAEVAVEEAGIKTLLTADDFYTVTISSGVYTCRVTSFSFGTPAGTDADASKTYQIELATLPDFSLEGRSLTGGPLAIAGVAFDVATSFSHNINRDGGDVTSETVNAGGKKFFSTMVLAETYKNEIDAKVVGQATFASSTGKILSVKSISWSEPKRDAHYPDGTRRYSIQFSLSLGIDKSAAGASLSGVVLGVSFSVLASHSFSASIDDEGFVTTYSQSGNGKVDSVPAIRPGESVTEDGRKYFITSLSLGKPDESGRRQVSISGQTLDTAKAVEELFPDFFYGFALDHVDSTTKGVNYSFDKKTGVFKAQSISASVSGFTIGSNKGVLGLINTISRSVGSFIITSVSTGAPEPKRRNGVLEKRFPISISGTLNLVGEQNSGEEVPDIKVEESRSVNDSVTKYTQVPIPGKGIVFKKIGVTQAEESVTIRHVAKDEAIFKKMGYPADPVTSLIGGEKVGRSTSRQGLTKSVALKYAAFPPDVGNN